MTGMHRLTKEQLDSFSYTSAELRQLAAAGVDLPPKPLNRPRP